MRIAYINGYDYANGTANSIRAAGFVRALQESGHQVSVMAHETYVSHSVGQILGQPGLRRLHKLHTLAVGTAVREWLDGLQDHPDVVIVYGTDVRFLRPARVWAAAHGLPLLVDVVDWYDPREGTSLGEIAFILLNTHWGMPHEVARANGVVVASTYLDNYFCRKLIPSLRVPALVTVPPAVPGLKSYRSEELTLAYVGNPGRKDAYAVENLKQLAGDSSADLPRVVIHFVGNVKPDVSSSDRVEMIYHGRLPRPDALQIVRSSDFTVLQRPAARRFARAGFPSKVAESLLVGTPVLTNNAGDVAEYVVDYETGLILRGHDYEDLRNGVIRAAELRLEFQRSREQIAGLAASSFKPSNRSSDIGGFVEAVVQKFKLECEGTKRMRSDE